MSKNWLAIGSLRISWWLVAVIVFAGLARTWIWFRVDPLFWQPEESIENSYDIIFALHDYCSRRGTFPENLAELQQDMDREFPAPKTGTRKWIYSRDEDDGGPYFILQFEARGGYPLCYYDSCIGRWIEDS